MTDLILTLLGLGYTVTFEGDALGGCFVLLRRVETMELVNCTIGDTPEEALQGAMEWEISRQLGNGTAARPPQTWGEIFRNNPAHPASDARLAGNGQDPRTETLVHDCGGSEQCFCGVDDSQAATR